ncbi:MAG: 3-deoxy-7-phosphoheptulonate synthase [Bacteroidia bacterium]|nr:3-deoxy-7-phosphoheptulonate synthase [Bacteroidia bacterium]
MIIEIKVNTDKQILEQIASELQGILIHKPEGDIIITGSKTKKLPEKFNEFAEKIYVFENDMQLSSRQYRSKREIRFGELVIGGIHKNTLLMAGPCAVENHEMIDKTALLLKELNIKVLRAGAYKPRTSPYSFQGLGLDGLKLLDKMRKIYDLKIISEVRDSTHADEVIAYSDIVQIGAKSMYDHGILRKCGKTRKPVLLKRGFGTTLQEFVQAAEFILSEGNDNVILCERGIRTFENKTRFTLDLCCAAYLKQYTNLPIVLDPSHAIGYAYGVHDLARACVAMGVDGLLIEVHPDPSQAKSDASQQINHEEFKRVFESIKAVANAIGYKII